MSFLVAIDQKLRPDCIAETLAAVQADFATSRNLHPGRRRTRVFQGIIDRSHLLAIGEWERAEDYHRLYRSSRYQELVVCADPPADIASLRRLRLFARMSIAPSIVACVTMTAPDSQAAAFRAYVLGGAPTAVEAAPGLLSHEVYQVGAAPGALLAVHGWRSLADLERFRTQAAPRHASAFARFDVTVERFTGVIAADYSRAEALPNVAPRELRAMTAPLDRQRLPFLVER